MYLRICRGRFEFYPIGSAIHKKKKKYSTRAPRSGVRSQQVSVVSWRYTGGRPEMLGGPSSGEPAGERTTCRRDRWGQTAVVHSLLPSSSPLLYSRSTRAQRSPTPFCPFLPAAWSSPPLTPPHSTSRHRLAGLARAILTPRARDGFPSEWISHMKRKRQGERKNRWVYLFKFISIRSISGIFK